jgi:hypothetical protein
LSRLGRNNVRTLLFLDYLEEKGIRVLTSDGRYDSCKDDDLVGIETWLNERYLKDISRKTRSSLRFRINRGDYIGTAPYGYIKTHDGTNRLDVDEDAADVVRKIYSLYRAGYGYSYIAGYLNDNRYSSPSKYKTEGRIRYQKTDDSSLAGWNPVTVSRILSSRVYTGDTIQGVSEKISFKSKKTRKLPESLWVITENTHEPIVDIKEFREIQKIRESKNNFSGSHKGKLHPFRSRIFCGRCGSHMIARKRKNRPMGYICATYGKNGRELCTSHHIRESVLKGIIVDEMRKLFDNAEVMAKAGSALFKPKNSTQTPEILLEKLKKQSELKRRQQELLYIDRLEGKISEQLFIRANKSLENSIARINEKVETIIQTVDVGNDSGKIVFEAKESFLKGEIGYDIISLMVDKILVFDSEDTKFFKSGYISEKKNICINGAIVVDFRINKV